MKIVKILLKASKNMSEESIKAFIYNNFPADILRGLEYDDPKTISRVLKMLNIKEPKKEPAEQEQE